MKNIIFIYGHLGLGDQIACNGIIRAYTEKYDKVNVFTKPNNLKNVCRMFSDNSKISIISMSEPEVRQFMSISPNNNYLIVGHEKLHKELAKDENGRFDQIFYKMADVPFKDKWNKFYLHRDIESEKDVFYNKLKLKDDEEFIFVHDDKERSIPLNRLSKNIKIIKPDRKDISIFDFLYTIEKAKEVHCIDSSFFNLIDCIQLRSDDQLFFHKYVKIHLVGEGGTPTSKLKWKIIEK